MTKTLTTEEQVDIISRAWGDQEGYCFFPTMKGDARTKAEREFSYREHEAFYWPRDKAKIIAHLNANRDNDVFWCPMLFEYPRRRTEAAMDEYSLWADLDEVDPREIDEQFRPSIYWETSPGRYQALWILKGMLQGASASGKENHKLTMYLGADDSGWDTTQLLRIPGWPNHKPVRREENDGIAPQGWVKVSPLRYGTNVFQDLPEVESTAMVEEVVESELAEISREDLWAKIRLKLKPRMRDFFYAKEARGDRSETLWQMERDLADLGLSVAQIVALVRPTVWNKYVGRGDELLRLSTEASRAIAQKDAIPEDQAFVEVMEPSEGLPKSLVRWVVIVPQAKEPDWLIKDIWTVAGCGFIAGQPKSFKSWFALDMAFAIATGGNFLGHYPVRHPGPVLYIQEEDGLPVLKKRQAMMDFAPHKDGQLQPDGTLLLEPKNPHDRDPDIYPVVQAGFTISKPGDMVWLDERLDEMGDCRAVILDPLIRMMGETDDHRAPVLNNEVFKPLSDLSVKHEVAIIVVHHMKKGEANGQRGGQMMLGSVAHHAWLQDGLFLFRQGNKASVDVHTESKNAPSTEFKVHIGNIARRGWCPTLSMPQDDEDTGDTELRQAHKPPPTPRIVTLMQRDGRPRFTTTQLAALMNITTSGAHKQATRALTSGHLIKPDPHHYALNTKRKA